MAGSSISSSHYHVRSISLPGRSHPTTAKIEEELNKLKTWEASATPTAKTVCDGLSGLEDLYKCTNGLLDLPHTKQVLSCHQHEKYVDEPLDRSLRLLDVCGFIRDVLSQTKEHVGDLQSALRRKKEDSSIENSIAKYTAFRKKMKKNVTMSIAALKFMDNERGRLLTSGLDQHLSAVIRVLREVSAMSISIFQLLLLFLSVPVSRAKPTGWSLVSKLMRKGAVACENQLDRVNDLESVDAALYSLNRYGGDKEEHIQVAQSRLKGFLSATEHVENGLESMFRQLIRTRASLLNIVPQ